MYTQPYSCGKYQSYRLSWHEPEALSFSKDFKYKEKKNKNKNEMLVKK